MKVSAQVSLYPLREQGVGRVIASFAEILQNAEGLEVRVGPMSTLLTGDADRLFPALLAGFESVGADHQVVMAVTVSNACPVPTGATPDSESDSRADER